MPLFVQLVLYGALNEAAISKIARFQFRQKNWKPMLLQKISDKCWILQNRLFTRIYRNWKPLFEFALVG